MYLNLCERVFGLGFGKFFAFMITQPKVKDNPKKYCDMLSISCSSNLETPTP